MKFSQMKRGALEPCAEVDVFDVHVCFRFLYRTAKCFLSQPRLTSHGLL